MFLSGGNCLKQVCLILVLIYLWLPHFHRDAFRLYTQSECILDCRIRDVIEMCGCLPVPFSDIYRAPDCLLDDFNCLSSWTEQWLQSRTKNKRPMEDSRESIEPKCPHCLKRCNYIQYLTTTSKADFDATAHNKMSDRESFLYVLATIQLIKIRNREYFLN